MARGERKDKHEHDHRLRTCAPRNKGAKSSDDSRRRTGRPGGANERTAVRAEQVIGRGQNTRTTRTKKTKTKRPKRETGRCTDHAMKHDIKDAKTLLLGRTNLPRKQPRRAKSYVHATETQPTSLQRMSPLRQAHSRAKALQHCARR